jgi:HEPN domain-containing protein
MMTKQDHIAYWTITGTEDWDRALYMMQKKDFVFALFCVHLSLEKYCKALWVKSNVANHPPRTHDLKLLLADTAFDLSAEQAKYVDDIQKYQIEGRYPDYRKLIYRYTTEAYAMDLLKKGEELKACLHEEISKLA